MRAKEIADHFFVEDDYRNKNLEIMVLRYLEEISSHKDDRIAELENVVKKLLEAYDEVIYKSVDAIEPPNVSCLDTDILNDLKVAIIKARKVLEGK